MLGDSTVKSNQSLDNDSPSETEAVRSDAKIDEQFQECLRIISEEGNRQRLVKEFEKEKNVLLSSDSDAVARVEHHIIEYISEVLTYIDFSKMSNLSDRLVDFLSTSEFQATFKQTVTLCLQIAADRINDPNLTVEPQTVEDWTLQLLKSVKNPDFACRVFQAWTSKRESEKLFENISALYDGKYSKQNQEGGTPWKKIQRALNIDIKDLAYTIAVFAKCYMSFAQADLDKIMPDAIKKLEIQKPAAFSKDSMSNFFKAVQKELETMREEMIVRR
jgi:hypothetical protein